MREPASAAADSESAEDGDLGKEHGLTKVEHVLQTFSLSERAGGHHGAIYNAPGATLTPSSPQTAQGEGAQDNKTNQNKNI